MSSVFQQIIRDTATSTPGGSGNGEVNRDKSNCGLLVKLSGDQTKRNKNAFAAPTVEMTQSITDNIFGALGDYHNERTCSIIRKGKVFVQSSTSFRTQHVGQQIVPVDNRPGLCQPATAGGTGEIIGGGTHEKLGSYFIVHLNLPG